MYAYNIASVLFGIIEIFHSATEWEEHLKFMNPILNFQLSERRGFIKVTGKIS